MLNKKTDKFLMTQSLLSSWQWGLKLENGWEDFIRTLNREPIEQSDAMLNGITFEDTLNATLNGSELDPKHEYYKPIIELLPTLTDAQQQVRLSNEIEVDGITYVIYGVLDYLKAGVIYDTKLSKTYRVGKYIDSPQHPMYFALVPEAYEFNYLISNGKEVFRERYTPDETEPIQRTIRQFINCIKTRNLYEIYTNKWKAEDKQ